MAPEEHVTYSDCITGNGDNFHFSPEGIRRIMECKRPSEVRELIRDILTSTIARDRGKVTTVRRMEAANGMADIFAACMEYKNYLEELARVEPDLTDSDIVG